jgi:hypothetical protein
VQLNRDSSRNLSENEEPPKTRVGRSLMKLARAVAAVLDSVAAAISAFSEFSREVVATIRDDWRSDKWSSRVLTAATGTAFASTGGFGLQPFANHESLSVLVAAPFWLPVVVRAFVYLNRDSERGQQRAHIEAAAVPDLDDQLAEEERKREDAASRCGPKVNPPLEKRRFVAEVLARSRAVANLMPAAPDISFFLAREIRGSRYEVVATRGPIEDDFKNGTIWAANQVFRRGDAFRAMVQPFQYRRSVVAFHVGGCQYFLVAIAGADLPDAVVHRVSTTATQLLILTAMDIAGEDWQTLLAAGGLG